VVRETQIGIAPGCLAIIRMDEIAGNAKLMISPAIKESAVVKCKEIEW
jgi:hypothetical protein